MKHSTRLLAVLAIICATHAQRLVAQHNTAVTDGVISAGEYGTHTDGQNQQTSGGQIWYMTWNDLDAFLGISGGSTAEGAVVYVDKDPLVPINGGTDANGTNIGQDYDGQAIGALPFRADLVIYVKDGYREYRLSDGAGGWSSPTTAFGSYASTGGTTREVAIPWSIIGGRPESFAWLGYLNSATGFHLWTSSC